MRRLRVGLPLAAIALVAAGVAVGQVTARSGDPTVTRTRLAQSTKVRGLLHKAKIVIYLATLLKTGAPPSTPNG